MDVFPALVAFLVWLLHFGFAYGAHALGCARGWASSPMWGVPVVPLVVGIATVVALGAVVAILVRAVLRVRGAPSGTGRFVDQVTAGLAALALVAIVFTALPVLMVSPCE